MTAAMCTDPGDVANATTNLIGISPGSSVIYTCNTGYKVSSGDVVRRCKYEGTWSGMPPVCSRKKYFLKENKYLINELFFVL